VYILDSDIKPLNNTKMKAFWPFHGNAFIMYTAANNNAATFIL
jgi:hypothetical protein